MGTTQKKVKTAHLELLSGETDEPSRIELCGSRVQLGRAVSNDVMINSAHVSRKHVVFSYVNNVWMVKDLSTNGVAINSKKLPKDKFIPLNNDDRISLVPTGALQYQFQYLVPNNSEHRKSGTLEVSWSVQHNEENIPSSPGLLYNTPSNQFRQIKPDCKSNEYKNLWKRPHNNMDVDYDSSSDSDEPKKCKKIRVGVKGEDSSADSCDSDDESNISRKLIKKRPFWIPINKLSPIIDISTAAQGSNSNSDPNVNGKDDVGNEAAKTDTKRKNEEQISSLKRKVQKLEGENSKLNKTCQRLEGEKVALEKEAQSEKLGIYSSIMDCFGTEFSCAICTEVFIDPTVINCGHTFCSFCLNQWLKEKSICCICRKSVTSQSRHVEVNNLLVSIWGKLPQQLQFKRQNDMRDREEAVQVAQARARAEANRPRPTATLGRGTAFIPEENFVSFLLSRHFFAQVVDREQRDPRPLTVSLRAGRILNNRSSPPPSGILRPGSPRRRPTTPPRPATPPRRRSARIQVRSQVNERN